MIGPTLVFVPPKKTIEGIAAEEYKEASERASGVN